MAALNLAAVRDWFNSRFKLTDEDTLSSVLTITFDASLLGETWTVTNENDVTDVHTGTVDNTLTAEVNIASLLTVYSVSCGDAAVVEVEIGNYFMPCSCNMAPPTLVEYIESSGTQYIDTGEYADETTEFELKFLTSNTLASSPWYGIFGSRTSPSTLACYVSTYSNATGCGYFKFNDTGYNVAMTASSEETYTLSNGTFTDTSGTTMAVTTGSWEGTFPMFLFAMNNNGTASCGSHRIYYLKLWKNGSLVRHFKPCLDSNGVACMYDAVSQTFFYNAGSGTFIAGAEI